MLTSQERGSTTHSRIHEAQGGGRQLAADIKELENAPDHHTVDNRGKRGTLQGKRDDLAKVQNALAENFRQGQRAMQNLLQSVETNLALASYAETWEWKEAEVMQEG